MPRFLLLATALAALLSPLAAQPLPWIAGPSGGSPAPMTRSPAASGDTGGLGVFSGGYGRGSRGGTTSGLSSGETGRSGGERWKPPPPIPADPAVVAPLARHQARLPSRQRPVPNIPAPSPVLCVQPGHTQLAARASAAHGTPAHALDAYTPATRCTILAGSNEWLVETLRRSRMHITQFVITRDTRAPGSQATR
ncbi:hypothetical protein [Sabulicella glaciei]|uniref:Uncharacterized protein n=1 Tax=Sabulicella glaciei TaxID=2984948 RepID=A0ABT3P211_9PROT|nr:hypothetical protein [Roseococcus sp. MDT2-1-1]MCW8088426.1 hypothetical protein [Roseococcus sp. MDT2-1-1]